AQVSIDGQVHLEWTGVPSAEQYQIHKKIDDGDTTLVTNNVASSPYAFTLAEGNINGSYSFSVTACNSAGCATPTFSEAQPVSLLPIAPVMATYTEEGTPAYLLVWSEVSNADYYQIQRQDEQGT